MPLSALIIRPSTLPSAFCVPNSALSQVTGAAPSTLPTRGVSILAIKAMFKRPTDRSGPRATLPTRIRTPATATAGPAGLCSQNRRLPQFKFIKPRGENLIILRILPAPRSPHPQHLVGGPQCRTSFHFSRFTFHPFTFPRPRNSDFSRKNAPHARADNPSCHPTPFQVQ